MIREAKAVVLNYIYMTNFPIYVYFFYFLIGIGLNVISYNVAINNFNTTQAPFFVMFLLFLVGNILLILLLQLISFHIGLYFLLSIIIPYAVVWRTDF